MSPSVALCMIVKNEENNLKACVGPVAHLFREIQIVDTGSTDRTKTIAQELGAHVSDFTWRDDFSAARNAALAQATSDWIFWLDADDRIKPDQVAALGQLFTELNGPRAYLMKTIIPRKHAEQAPVVCAHCRLFSRHPQVRWARRVHEQILPGIQDLGWPVTPTKIGIVHEGYADPALLRRKTNRNLRILKAEYAALPNDSIVLYHLGAAHADLGERQQALAYFMSSIKNLENVGEWGRRLFAHTAELLGQLSRREEALSLIRQGLQLFPDDAEMLTRQGQLLAQLGDVGGAELSFLRALYNPGRNEIYLGEQKLLDGTEAALSLGTLYLSLGRLREAERIFQEHLAKHPLEISAWYYLGHIALDRGRWPDAEHAARQVEKCGSSGPLFARMFRAELYLRQGELRLAKEHLDEVISEDPKLVWAYRVLAVYLQKIGASLEERIAVERNILRLNPGDASAESNLAALEPKVQNSVPQAALSYGFSFTI